jgi:hypothetical protein
LALPLLPWPASFVVLTPEVFELPLLLVTTAVLDETVLPFAFERTLAFVSITPSLAGLPVVVAPLAFAALAFAVLVFEFVVVLSPPQPIVKLAAAKTAASAKVRRIKFLLADPSSTREPAHVNCYSRRS